MTLLEQTLTLDRCFVDIASESKKAILEQIAQLLEDSIPDLDRHGTFENLIAREKLGSTGFGNGIAIPHCRISGCSQPACMVLQLEHAIDFDAIDAEPVDLLFVLVVPEDATEAHLGLLSAIAGMLNKSTVREDLRSATTSQELYQIILAAQEPH